MFMLGLCPLPGHFHAQVVWGNKFVHCVVVLPKASGSLCPMLIFPDNHHGCQQGQKLDVSPAESLGILWMLILQVLISPAPPIQGQHKYGHRLHSFLNYGVQTRSFQEHLVPQEASSSESALKGSGK